MGFFSRKTEVDVTDFFWHFYNTHIFEGASLFAEQTLELLRQADPVFAEMDFDLFAQQLKALRCEVVATAWTHVFNDETSLRVSQVTREVLGPELWEPMSHYNRMLAKSPLHGADPKSGMDRAKMVFINKSRADLFDAWHAKGWDPEVMARVFNRFGTKHAWKTGKAQTYLIIALSRALGLTQEPGPDGVSQAKIGPNGATAFADTILEMVNSLYDKARLAAKEVRFSL